MFESIGLFGGTFNPPHNGHIRIIKTALEYFKFSKLIVMPVFLPPHKDILDGWDAKTRYFMTGISIYSFSPNELDNHFCFKGDSQKWERFKEFYAKNFPLNHNPDIILSDFEIKKGGRSYTIETVKFLKSIYPQADIHIIIGFDEALLLDKWKDYKKLLEISKFVVVKRKGFDETFLMKKFPDLNFLPFEEIDISSTEIRQKIKEGKNVSEYLPPVLKLFLDTILIFT